MSESWLLVLSQGQGSALWGLMLFIPGFLDGDASENQDHCECHPIYPGDPGPIALPVLRVLRDVPRKQRG